MTNKGNIILFTSTTCKVMDEEIRKFIARVYRNPDKLYVSKELNSHINEEDSNSK